MEVNNNIEPHETSISDARSEVFSYILVRAEEAVEAGKYRTIGEAMVKLIAASE